MSSGKRIVSLAIFFMVWALMSCTPKLTKQDAFPKMYEELPRAIIVLPPLNESTAAEAQDYYSTTILEPLAEAGYYVYPIEVLNQILQEQGLYEIENIENIPVDKFFDFFAADAVLFTKILKWDTSYYVVGGKVTVSVDFKLVSTKTAAILWEYNGQIVVDTTGDSGKAQGLAGLLVLVATTAINTAATDYIPQAKKANIQALHSIPYGTYHKMYNKDQKVEAVNKVKVKENNEKTEKSE